ncbi:MAG: hypothetical protein K1060chlam2_01262 [Chlamydiae bacterium]|nr:hypothetical protein [Chlamydiota bacterium]
MKKNITATNCTIIGFGYFVTRPYLWLGPLLAALVSFLVLLSVFFITAYLSWPIGGDGWYDYTWGMFRSLGYASFAIIALWVSLFPVILNFAFENMIGRVLHDQQVPIKAEGMMRAIISSVQVIVRTLGWRLFWPLATLLSLFILGPLALFVAQIGMGHIAIIDATDLSMAIQGIPGKRRIKEIRKRFPQILTAGIIAGMVSTLLTTTIIGWLFWLPSVYVGCTLWTLNWPPQD